MMRTTTSLLLAIAALLTGASASTAAGSLHDCGSAPVAGGPRNDRSLPITDITERGMGCRTARRTIRAGRITIHGCFGPGPCSTRFRTPHFRCRSVKLGLFDCRRSHHRELRFSWSE
jgi:hypothetical protein